MSAAIEAELISSPMLVPRVSDLQPLTVRESAFVQHYLDPENYRNGTKAAELAGYSGDYNTLAQTAHQNLNKPKIQAHIQHALKLRHISPNEVIAELSDIALLPANALQSPFNPHSPYNASHKLKALETAGKYHQLWDKAETGPNVQVNLNSESLTIVLQQVLNEITSTDTDS
jgi:predicted NACHT family NTPase